MISNLGRDKKEVNSSSVSEAVRGKPNLKLEAVTFYGKEASLQ